jgi:hypothetical protein
VACLRRSSPRAEPGSQTVWRGPLASPVLLPGGLGERRVRSRGLANHRGRARQCGIRTQAIRRPLVVSGAGERPAKSSLTSPGFTLPEGSPWWRAFAHRADTYAKRARSLSLGRRLYAGRAVSTVQLVRSSRACVPRGDRTIVLWLHRKFGRRVCQPFSLDAMGRTPEDLITAIMEHMEKWKVAVNHGYRSLEAIANWWLSTRRVNI